MARISTLLHGEAAEVSAILSGDDVTDNVVDLRAALANALNRIDVLEKRTQKQSQSLGSLRRRTPLLLD